METKEKNKFYHYEHSNRFRRILGGMVLIGIGIILLAKKMGALIPDWVFSWQMLIIVFGIYIGAKRAFRGIGWLIPVVIGSVLLMDKVAPELSIKPYLWPTAIIVAGLSMILRPHRGCRSHRWKRWEEQKRNVESFSSPEDTINSHCVFSGVKKNIISKDFKGGQINCVFGGAEIDLSQCDINGKVILELENVFGGTKLIIPSNWMLQNELVTVMGGVEDKRYTQQNTGGQNEKILILRGNVVFGGVEIKN